MFAGMAERRMAKVMSQTGGFNHFGINSVSPTFIRLIALTDLG